MNFISKSNYINVIYTCLAALCFISCLRTASTNATQGIKFQLNTDSTEIVLTGLDHNIIESLKNDSLLQYRLQAMYKVYHQPESQKPAESENLYAGKYKIISNKLIYVPDSVFVKGDTYRAEFYIPQFYDRADVLNKKELPGKIHVEEQNFNF